LDKGRAASGIVVDQKTGHPLQGVSVYAHKAGRDWDKEKPFYVDADALTDKQGRFYFTRLRPDWTYTISARDGQSGSCTLPTDETQDLRISLKPSAWWLENHPQEWPTSKDSGPPDYLQIL
ncbi:carboxypeptidase-like regulatory domain-containing protein, partial [Pontiella sp.]|uniref:carboxypeptidase-like regulatory domain-containing protein n=1 Tax=Pontiella sp. TaxID=2837462 RepID=UPI00356791BC